MREFFVKLSKADRRWVFLGVAICTIFPFFVNLNLPLQPPSRYTQAVFDEVDNCGPDTKPILLSMDYDPGTLAELQPMAEAVLRHIFKRKGKVIVTTFMPTGAGLAQETIYRIAGEFPEIKEGEHFAFMGFNTPPLACIQSIGVDFRINYPKDIRGIEIDEIPIFKGVKNYDDIHLVLDLAGNNLPEYWIAHAHERFGARVAMGVTNVQAADYTPFVATGQSLGMLQGMGGAAEYERLLVEAGYWPIYGDATRGMDSQSVTHVFIIVLIVLGNVGYFLDRKMKGVQG